MCYHENNVPSRLSPQWLCSNSCTWAHDVRLLRSLYYTHLASVRFEQSVCHGSLMTTYIYIIYIYIYISILGKCQPNADIYMVNVVTSLLT